MVTEELRNYVSRSRQQGMTDQQIESVLRGQGWSGTDINEVLGRTASSPSTKNTPWVKIILVSFLIFVVGAVVLGAIRDYKIKKGIENFVEEITNPSFFQNDGTESSDENGGANNEPTNNLYPTYQGGAPSGKDCVGILNLYLSVLKPVDFTATGRLPSSFPSDLPKYPGSKFANGATLNQEFIDYSNPKQVRNLAYFCTSDGLSQVESYFKNSGSGWTIATTNEPVQGFNPYSGGNYSINWLIASKDLRNPNLPIIYILLIHPQDNTYIEYLLP